MSMIEFLDLLRQVLQTPYKEYYALRVVKYYASGFYMPVQHKLERKMLENARSAMYISDRELNHIMAVFELSALFASLQRPALRPDPERQESVTQLRSIAAKFIHIRKFCHMHYLFRLGKVEATVNLIQDQILKGLQALRLTTQHEYHMCNRLRSYAPGLIADIKKAESREADQLRQMLPTTMLQPSIGETFVSLCQKEEGKRITAEIVDAFGSGDVCDKAAYDRLKQELEEAQNMPRSEASIIRAFLELMALYSQNNRRCTTDKCPNQSELVMEVIALAHEKHLLAKQPLTSRDRDDFELTMGRLFDQLETKNKKLLRLIEQGCSEALKLIDREAGQHKPVVKIKMEHDNDDIM